MSTTRKVIYRVLIPVTEAPGQWTTYSASTDAEAAQRDAKARCGKLLVEFETTPQVSKTWGQAFRALLQAVL